MKSVRGLSYDFLPKDRFPLRPDGLAAVVILIEDRSPDLYLIPAPARETASALLVSRDYEGKQSKPEWGLSLSARNLPLLAPFAFDSLVGSLMHTPTSPPPERTGPAISAKSITRRMREGPSQLSSFQWTAEPRGDG